ncbi:MAG: iron ABC transporter permease [Bryobacterales bacterium]|jgi:iron complex transport system permease protein|nr:iron ABC transporter permease [Bryobacterales bacterium]
MNPLPEFRWIAVCAAAFVAALLLLPWVGPGPISWEAVLAKQSPDYPILVELRLSRTLLGLLVGGALALAGALFQAMLRDSLATPYTLGVSAGASLGAILALAFRLPAVLGLPATWMGALAGAALVLFLVAAVSQQQGQLSSVRLLLTGISLNGVCSAFILLIHSVAPDARSLSITHWLLGNLDSISFSALGVFALVVIVVAVHLLRNARQWNLMMVGEAWAASRGASPKQLMRTGFLCGSVLTGGAIALSGPIGFVGLVIPHIVRSRFSADYRVLLPCSFLLGGALLAAADSLGRLVIAPAELPAGALMALLGGPYLVWLVRRRF